jgi:hypothetical protein
MTDVYEFSEYERGKLLYNFSTLTPEQAAEKKANLEKFNAEKEALKAAAAAEAAAKPKIEKPQDKTE